MQQTRRHVLVLQTSFNVARMTSACASDALNAGTWYLAFTYISLECMYVETWAYLLHFQAPSSPASLPHPFYMRIVVV